MVAVQVGAACEQLSASFADLRGERLPQLFLGHIAIVIQVQRAGIEAVVAAVAAASAIIFIVLSTLRTRAGPSHVKVFVLSVVHRVVVMPPPQQWRGEPATQLATGAFLVAEER